MFLRLASFRSATFALSLVCLTVAAQGPQPARVPPLVQTKLNKLAETLARAEASRNLSAQAAALTDAAYIYLDDLRLTTRAAETFTRALPIARAASDRREEALILLGQAVVRFRHNQYPDGIAVAREQLGSAGDDPEIEARASTVLGFGVDHQNDLPQAIALAGRANSAATRIADPTAKLRTLLKLADLLRLLADDGSPQVALTRTVNATALALARQLADASAEAHALYGLAKADALADQPRLALEGYNAALTMLAAQEDQYGVRGLLLDRAAVYKQFNDLPKALDDVNRRAALLEQNGESKAATQTRIFASDMLADLGRFDEALDYANRALEEARREKLPDVEAYALTVIGSLYYSLGQGQRALDATDRALALLRETGPQNRVADTLRVVGSIQRDLLNDPGKAAEAFRQAARIYAAGHDEFLRAATLLSLCRVYGQPIGNAAPLDPSKALVFCAQALDLARSTDNPEAVKESLLAEGDVYAALGDHAKALDAYDSSLPLVVAGKKPQEQSDLFFGLMKEYAQSRPPLAVFFGKKSVNLLQEQRGNLRRQEAALQASYVQNYAERYRTLASILIAQGRLPEAQQVLDLLKQQEFAEYTRGEAASTTMPVEFTPAEEMAASDYQRTSMTIVADSEEFARLKKIEMRTPVQEAEYQRLSAALSMASKGLNDFYDRLYLLFGKNVQANKQLADVKGTAAQLKQQIARTTHAVALYTLVNQTRLSILVITPGAMVAREVPIAEADLNLAVQNLRHALQDPSQDPRAAAKAMYRILVAPVQGDLDQASADTIIWSLDGVLRYIPMAALYDGKRYLVERYNSVNFTPAGSTYLADKPVFENMNAVAMGVSMQFDKDLIALPAVATELRQIVHEPQSPAGGALPGAILLDSAFTEKGMEDKLNGQHQIVHIASHFVSRSGDDRRSYLLLAGKDMRDPEGYHLTVADFRDDQRISLENTDLLTLSACDTGLSRSASDGHEVDGLAATAQIKGAKAVLSSLWKVNDASTGLFMADFYKRWVDGQGKLMKVQAIRQAQLDLLLKRNPQNTADFAHPYFWAPFVLVGNWR